MATTTVNVPVPGAAQPAAGGAEEEKKIRPGPHGPAWDRAIGRFENARKELKVGARPVGPIAMIDMGELFRRNAAGALVPKHVDLPAGRISEPLRLADASKSDHAMEVASLLSEFSNAPIVHYNVWTEKRLDPVALDAALDHILRSDASVLNLSVEFRSADVNIAKVRDKIEQIMAKGIIVVAAAGESAQPTAIFPAEIKGVIAVGGVDPHGRPIKDANGGDCIEGPAISIAVAMDEDDHRLHQGTSYATPLVAAAIWQLLGQLDDLDSQKICALLQKTARKAERPENGQGASQVGVAAKPFQKKVGNGRLDLNALLAEVKRIKQLNQPGN